MSIFKPKPADSGEPPDAPKKGGRLPVYLYLLVAACAFVKSDVHTKFEEWIQKCDESALIEKDPPTLPLKGFESQHLQASEMTEWPEEVENPLSKIRPTFDDGPHPNDLKLAEVLQRYPFLTPIFYYNGQNFFTEEALQELEISQEISPGKWIAWAENGAGIGSELRNQDPELYEAKLAEFLRTKLDPAKLAIAKKIYESGNIIGFHGMTHAPAESEFHLQNQTTEQFDDELEIFQRIIRLATEDSDYQTRNIRPTYGAGTNNFFTPDFIESCKKRGIEVRNWSFSSFDWQPDDKRGEQLLVETLRVVAHGEQPDILFHSQHQDGTTLGNLGKMLSVWTGHVLSLSAPERQAEVQKYRQILENVLSDTPEKIQTSLPSSSLSIGSSAQIVVDSAYNVELETEYTGAVQANFGLKADGYIGASTVDAVRETDPLTTSRSTELAIARILKDPKTFSESPLGKDVDTFPPLETLILKDVTFANRGLQVKHIATDILCRLEQDSFDAKFLNGYRLNECHIDSDMVPIYERMFNFLTGLSLDKPTIARVMATAIIETGLKNALDDIGIGKGTAEVAGEALNWVFDGTTTVPKILRKVGLKKPANTLQYGLGSIGPGQVPATLSQAMFELILKREITRAELEKILESPEGAAFAIYLYQRQYKTRLGSQIY
jgi:peptidoglycan/xylan/chitin deacetylase (PgdA/CDA1 family)